MALVPACMGPGAQEHQRGHLGVASPLCPLQPSPGGAFVRETPASSAGCAGAAGEGILLVHPEFPCHLQQCWSKDQLPLIVTVFQEVLPPKLFDLLILTLCRQASAFTTSLNYTKLVTAVLTIYQSQVRKTRFWDCWGCS